jgi:hypothetical protein
LSAPYAAPPPIVGLGAGMVLHRVHGDARPAPWFGRGDATSRWDDPNRNFGVLYLARSPVGAFAETLLRAPYDRDILWSHVRQKRQAVFQIIEPVQILKLHGEGLAWFGVTASHISESDYALPQRIADQAYHKYGLHGVQYRSRFDND